jgi:hypothetical protein
MRRWFWLKYQLKPSYPERRSAESGVNGGVPNQPAHSVRTITGLDITIADPL